MPFRENWVITMLMKIFFLTHVVSTITMTGIIWFIQLVHYPLLKLVGKNEFASYEISHTKRITCTVAPLMFVELFTGLCFLWKRPTAVTLEEAWIGAGLLGVIWLSTIFLQVPQHHVLARHFDAGAHEKLVNTNWVRVLAWSLRTWLVFHMLLK